MFSKAIFLCLCFLSCTIAANILAIYYHGGKSHHILGKTLLKELARRGHNVTMVSPFPLKEPFPNYTDINLTGILEHQMTRENDYMQMNQAKLRVMTSLPFALELTETQTEMTLNHTEMAKLLNSGTKFDVIIIDWFLNYGLFVFGHLFNAPIIGLLSHGTSELASEFMKNPAPLSYVPKSLLPYKSNMTFTQRIVNTVLEAFYLWSRQDIHDRHSNLIKKYYKNSPSYEELKKNVALLLSNAHYSYESPRPLVPSIIPIGGFHVQAADKLPNDLQKFMDDAKIGVIYFSLGTNMKSILLPEEKRQAILKAFSKLPYKILLKWEKDNLPNKPNNVLIRSWFPQNSLLVHPNLKLFISHGGLLSTIEALYFATPVLGIPIFGDQFKNILNIVETGYGLSLTLDELNENSLINTITELITNPKYAENAKKQSNLLHDQPIKPMDSAVFWIEHVIRHKGAPHLRNSAMFLNSYQYFLLDVFAFFIAIFVIFLIIAYFIIKKLKNIFKKLFVKPKSE